MSSVVSDTPGVNLSRFSGAVASSAPTTNSSRCSRIEQVVELGATLGLGPGEAQRGDRFVDRAVRVGARRVLAHTSAVQQPRAAVVALARVDLRSHPATESYGRGRPVARVRAGRGHAGQYPWPDVGGPGSCAARRRGDCARRSPRPVGRSCEAIVKTARPKQWTKNVLVFAAPAAAGRARPAHALLQTLVAFIGFCFAASGTYFLNDANDAEVDRLHPTKRLRPIAAGDLDVRTARIIGGGADPACRSSSPRRSTTSSSPA